MTPGFFFLTGFLAGAAVVAAAGAAALWTFGGKSKPAASAPDDRAGWDDVLAIKDEAERRDAILRRSRANPANRTMWDE